MAIGRREKVVTIGDKEYLLAFDNLSIKVYKDLYNKNFMTSFALLGQWDDQAIIDFATATVRDKDNPDTPLGVELLNRHDLLEILLGCGNDVVEFVIAGLPKKSEKK